MNLAAIQAQMLQTLLAAMQSADQPFKAGASVRATFTGWSTPDGQPPAAGQVAAAQALIGREPVTVMIAADAARRQALQPGVVMTLVVEQAPTPASPARMRLTAITEPAEQGNAQPRAGQAWMMPQGVTRSQAFLPPAAPPALAAMARALAGPAISAALARQDSLAPLLANLAALTHATADPRQFALTSAIPRPVLAAAGQVLALQLPVRDSGDEIEPAALKQAVLRSGLFHEAQLARGRPAEAASDLKSALLVLRGVIRTALGNDGDAPPAPRDNGPPLPEAGRARTDKAVASQPMPADQPAPRPMPPMRDALPQPQAANAASLDLAADSPTVLLTKLGEQTEAALDRLSLSQFASLPTAQESVQGGPLHRWFVEAPLGLGTGPGILPLEIEADHGAAGGVGGEARTWRVRFALDLDPIGPIHGLVSMQAKAVSVAVWAERESTSKLVRDFAPDLQSALEESVFERAEIEVITGRPTARAPASGYYLDRVS